MPPPFRVFEQTTKFHFLLKESNTSALHRALRSMPRRSQPSPPTQPQSKCWQGQACSVPIWEQTLGSHTNHCFWQEPWLPEVRTISKKECAAQSIPFAVAKRSWWPRILLCCYCLMLEHCGWNPGPLVCSLCLAFAELPVGGALTLPFWIQGGGVHVWQKSMLVCKQWATEDTAT